MANRVTRPVISVPLKVQRTEAKRQDKLRAKQLEAQHSRYFEGDRTIPPLISCRRQELDHYKGQMYAPFKKLPMASEHWMSRSTIGDFFAFAPFRGSSATSWYKYVPSPYDNLILPESTQQKVQMMRNSKPSFSDFSDLDSRLINGLNKIGIRVPTNIQHDALPSLLNGESGLIASETGNGKTVAFLLPALQKIMKVRATDSLRKFNHPLAVVVTPGRELAAQIKEVAESICSELDVKVKLVTGSSVEKKIEFSKRERVDLLIGSAGGMNKMFAGKLFFADDIQTVILDEIDTLVDDTFKGVTLNLLAKLRMAADQQIIFAGATMPKDIGGSLGQVIDTDSIKVIQTQHLHKVLPHVYQKFIRSPKINRTDYLLEILEKDVEKKRQVLIFSNKASTSAFISHFLNGKGIETLHFSGGNMHPTARKQSLDKFLTKQVPILSCTDLVSRGIDTQLVQHVINYDFPMSISDYLHRVGRVGRAGAAHQGKVTSLVFGKISIALVQELEKSVRLNKTIPNVDGNIIGLIQNYNSSHSTSEI